MKNYKINCSVNNKRLKNQINIDTDTIILSVPEYENKLEQGRSIEQKILAFITKNNNPELVINPKDLFKFYKDEPKLNTICENYGKILRYEYKSRSNFLYKKSDNTYEYFLYVASPKMSKEKYDGKKVNGKPEYDGYIKLFDFHVMVN